VIQLARLPRSVLRAVRQGEFWCAFVALSVGLSIASYLAPTGTHATPLTNFADRAINPAVIEGVDATSVGRSYGQFYLVLGLSFFALLILLGRLNGLIRARLPRPAVAKEQRGVLLLSEFALALFALQVVSGSAGLDSLRTTLHLGIALVVCVMLGKAAIASLPQGGATKLIIASLLDDSEFLIASLFVPIPLLFAVMLVVDAPLALPGQTVWSRFSLYALVLILLGVIYTGLVRRYLDRPGAGMSLGLFRLNSALIVAGIPISLIPLAMPIANEIQHRWAAVSPHLLAWLSIVVLLLMSVLLFRMQARGFITIGVRASLAGFYFPILVVTLVAFSSHEQTLVLGALDYLKMGEQTVPTQQLIRFGKIPFLDLLPSHGLSDLTSQLFYSLVNGYQGLDMVVWSDWVSKTGVYLLVYSFLAVTASPVVAVLTTVLMPVGAVVVAPYAVALLPAIALVVAIRRPSFWVYLSLWLLSAVLILWRWQQGSVAVLALLMVVAFELSERRESIAPAVKSLLTALALVPIFLIVMDVIWIGSIFEAIGALVATQSPKITAGSTSSAAPSVAVSLRYLLLPAVAVVVLLYYGLRRIVGPDRIRPRALAVVFASVFSLVVAVRAALWPSTGSWLDPVLFLLVLAVAPYCWEPAVPAKSMVRRSTIWLLTVFVLSVPIGNTTWGHLREPFAELSLAVRADPFRFHRWREGERRVLYDETVPNPIASFLDTELTEDETFFDFTDSPLLYVFTDREFPTQLIPNRSRTTDTIQSAAIRELDSLHEAGRLPLVLFRTEAEEASSRPELPTEVRSYRIAEFIYNHYSPWMELDGYEIWRQRGVELGRSRGQESFGPNLSVTLSQDFWLGKLPYVWARFDPRNALEKTEVLAELSARTTKVDTRRPMAVGVDVMTDRSDGNYLQIKARPLDGAIMAESLGSGPVLSIEYGRPRSSSFHFELLPKKAEPWVEATAVELPLLPKPELRRMRRVDRDGSLVLRSTGNDPHIFSFVDLEDAPQQEPGSELWLRLRYRSTSSDPMQLFFATDKSGFSEYQSIRLQTRATGLDGEIAEVAVPVFADKKRFSLVDLRVDPPSDSEFEIVAVELGVREPAFDDYLVRLSSQWRWASTNIDKLVLKASGPVLVGEVLLRRGD